MYKHVGRIKTNRRKVIVAYRTVPGEPENCVVVTTENLMTEEHDALLDIDTTVDTNLDAKVSEVGGGTKPVLLIDGEIIV